MPLEKPIAEIKVGDQVQAKDPTTGETKAEAVESTFDNKNPDGWVAIRVGNETLRATEEHPFWLPQEHRWVNAGALKAGAKLELPTGSEVEVAGVDP